MPDHSRMWLDYTELSVTSGPRTELVCGCGERLLINFSRFYLATLLEAVTAHLECTRFRWNASRTGRPATDIEIMLDEDCTVSVTCRICVDRPTTKSPSPDVVAVLRQAAVHLACYHRQDVHV